MLSEIFCRTRLSYFSAS